MLSMRCRIYMLLSLLIIALLIQNTCPMGFAGKSTVASTCSHCPQKQSHKTFFQGSAFSSVTKAPAHLPMYVLDMPVTQPACRLAAVASPQPVIPYLYRSTAPAELLQPPRG